MFEIKKMRDDQTISFAADELKKYLRMMMPEKGDIAIRYDPDATEGFRLGLLSDFGLSCECKDPKQDDIIHIETDVQGGILAGSNPRSVLFAVYRYLKLNGCRFFYPGPEGEYIPMKSVEPQKYHKMADHRLRGHTVEGEPSFEQVLNYIDFHAKEELNAFGLYCIDIYQRRYYVHHFNEKNRPLEDYDGDVAENQWRARYESELKKRGMIIFSGEHDLIPGAIGFDLTARELYRTGEKKIDEEIRPYLALLGGKRDLWRKDILYTNLCYSQPEVRSMIADQAVKMAQEKPHLDYIGFTFADGSKNHCECDACRKKRPSDWYVMILNEIDAKFTEKNIPMKVLFSFYVDTIFAPVEERLNNPERFLFQFCPIARSYMQSITEDTVIPPPQPFCYNGWERPKNTEEAYSLFCEWKKVFPGPYAVFEYHFWRHQYRDPGTMQFARRVYEDTLSHRAMQTCGCMQDGSNKSFWPNGFAEYIYAETLMNRDVDYEKALNDYYEALYGNDWEKVVRYLNCLSEAFSFAYMEGELSSDTRQGTHYNPERAIPLATVAELCADLRSMAKKRRPGKIGVQGLAWRLLLHHARYCDGLAAVMREKCVGNNQVAIEKYRQFVETFGSVDYETERYLDFGLAAISNDIIVKQMPAIEQ